MQPIRPLLCLDFTFGNRLPILEETKRPGRGGGRCAHGRAAGKHRIKHAGERQNNEGEVIVF